MEKGGSPMKFPIRRKEIVRSFILGLCTGLIGVLLFILLLNSMDSKNANNKIDKGEEQKISVSTETKENQSTLKDGTYEQFYANQHGVFSSFEAATEFVSQYPNLNTSAIVEVNENYYVWSSISPSKEDLTKMEEPASFTKPFKFSGQSCGKKELQELPSTLKSNDKSKYFFEGENRNGNFPSDWKSVTIALNSLSDDLSVIRMHLLAHYYSKNNCLKIEL